MDESVAMFSVLWEGGHSDADSDWARDSGEYVSEERATQFLGYRSGALERRRRKDDRELLASEAADEIHFAELMRKDACGVLQHFVTEQVAELVVDVLKVIDVDHEDREIAGIAICARYLFDDAFFESPSIEHAGESVAGRELANFINVDRVLKGGGENVCDGFQRLNVVGAEALSRYVCRVSSLQNVPSASL